MRTHPWLACTLLLASTAPAASALPAPVAQEGQQASATPAEKLAAIEKRYNDQQRAVGEAYGKATTDEERSEALKNLPGKEYVPEFRAVAEQAKGTDTAVKAWMWVLQLEPDAKVCWDAVELLLSEHMQSMALMPLTDLLEGSASRFGSEKVTEALRAIVAESPHDKVRAGALFGLGSTLLAFKDESKRAEGRDCLAAVIEEFGDVAFRGTTYGAYARGTLFEMDHLQIGMVAPDFETVDENGVAWKLSDYRGKVVVVDFWGYW